METIKEPMHPRRLEKNANITLKIGAAPPGGFHMVAASKRIKNLYEFAEKLIGKQDDRR
jgi:hypothetical protein